MKQRVLTLTFASLLLSACLSGSPPPLASDPHVDRQGVRPLQVSVLSDRIQCELATVFHGADAPSRASLTRFTSLVDLDLSIVQSLRAGASSDLTVAFAGGSVVPSLNLTHDSQATRTGKVQFSVDFADLASHRCATRGLVEAARTGWPESAGNLGLSDWLTATIPPVNRRVNDAATLEVLNYTLQFVVLHEVGGGFKIAPVNLEAPLSATAKSQTTNQLVVAIKRKSGAEGAPATAAGRRRRPNPVDQDMLQQQIDSSIQRITPLTIRPSPFIAR